MSVAEWPDKDFYAILGVGSQASEAEIGKAYKDLARKYHPDLNRDPGAEEKIRQITEAYEVLSSPDRRRLYNTMRAHFKF